MERDYSAMRRARSTRTEHAQQLGRRISYAYSLRKTRIVKDTGIMSLKLSKVGFGCWQLGSKGQSDYWGVKFTDDLASELVKLSVKTESPIWIQQKTMPVVILKSN